uniref:Uncharacterized protein LOC105641023 isoform X1 n=1 Tax=Rhizophora mucronata TaxID=61149 RepID=A0A2P2LCV1_RHIMU
MERDTKDEEVNPCMPVQSSIKVITEHSLNSVTLIDYVSGIFTCSYVWKHPTQHAPPMAGSFCSAALQKVQKAVMVEFFSSRSLDHL